VRAGQGRENSRNLRSTAAFRLTFLYLRRPVGCRSMARWKFWSWTLFSLVLVCSGRCGQSGLVVILCDDFLLAPDMCAPLYSISNLPPTAAACLLLMLAAMLGFPGLLLCCPVTYPVPIPPCAYARRVCDETPAAKSHIEVREGRPHVARVAHQSARPDDR
jgi:hypothetical protein